MDFGRSSSSSLPSSSSRDEHVVMEEVQQTLRMQYVQEFYQVG